MNPFRSLVNESDEALRLKVISRCVKESVFHLKLLSVGLFLSVSQTQPALVETKDSVISIT